MYIFPSNLINQTTNYMQTSQKYLMMNLCIFLPIVCDNIAASNHASIKGINGLTIHLSSINDGQGIVFHATFAQYVGQCWISLGTIKVQTSVLLEH